MNCVGLATNSFNLKVTIREQIDTSLTIKNAFKRSKNVGIEGPLGNLLQK
jgi:hypothetical protein